MTRIEQLVYDFEEARGEHEYAEYQEQQNTGEERESWSQEADYYRHQMINIAGLLTELDPAKTEVEGNPILKKILKYDF